jgi:hypothetical protein
MRSISKHLTRAVCVSAVFAILSAQAAVAAPRDDGDVGLRGLLRGVKHIVHFVVHVLDDGQLGVPHP